MPRIDDDMAAPVLSTDNTQWLEEIDARRSLAPEELLTFLEEQLDLGELTREEAIHYLNDLSSRS